MQTKRGDIETPPSTVTIRTATAVAVLAIFGSSVFLVFFLGLAIGKLLLQEPQEQPIVKAELAPAPPPLAPAPVVKIEAEAPKPPTPKPAPLKKHGSKLPTFVGQWKVGSEGAFRYYQLQGAVAYGPLPVDLRVLKIVSKDEAVLSTVNGEPIAFVARGQGDFRDHADGSVISLDGLWRFTKTERVGQLTLLVAEKIALDP